MEIPEIPFTSKGAIKTNKQKIVDINRVNRSYYLNLFSAAADITTNSATNHNIQFRWNIRDLQLGSNAEVALVQMIHTNAANGTGYVFRILETYADGFDSYNQTSAIVYMGFGLNPPSIPTYHKLISNNLNSITIVATDDSSSATTVYTGINNNITFGVVLHIIDYIDSQNTY